jgi:hypothetical protein
VNGVGDVKSRNGMRAHESVTVYGYRVELGAGLYTHTPIRTQHSSLS